MISARRPTFDERLRRHGHGKTLLSAPNSNVATNPDASIFLTNGGLTLRGWDVDIIFQAITTTVFRVDNANKRLKFIQGLNTPTGSAANVLYTSWAPPTGAAQKSGWRASAPEGKAR